MLSKRRSLGFTHTNASPGTDIEDGAALVIKQSIHNPQAILDSKVTGAIRNVTIRNSQGSGVILSTPTDFLVDKIVVDGYNLQDSNTTCYGVRIQRLTVTISPIPTPIAKSQSVDLGKITIQNGYLGRFANSLRDLYIASDSNDTLYKIKFSGPFSLRSDIITANDDVLTSAASADVKYINFGIIDTTVATGNATIHFPLIHTDKTTYHRVLYAALISLNPITGSLNYSAFSLKRSRAGNQQAIPGLTSFNIDNVARTADSEISLAPSAGDALTLIEPGDTLYAEFARSGGSGSKINGLMLAISTFSYTKI